MLRQQSKASVLRMEEATVVKATVEDATVKKRR